MGKIILSYILLCGIYFNQAYANDTLLNYKIIKSFDGDFTDFNVDNLGNIFLISATNQIKKINSNFDSTGVFNDYKQYGKIHFVDVSNPLKILVFYKDFSTVIVLDRFLSKRNTIDLKASNILQPKIISQSYDNNFWVFDEIDATIKKVDDNGRVISTFTDLRLLFDDVPTPSSIIDKEGLLYFYCDEYGWLIFDYYGALKNKITAKNWKDVQVINTTMLGRINNQFEYLSVSLPIVKTFKINLTLNNVTKVMQFKNYLYVLTKNNFSIYSN